MKSFSATLAKITAVLILFGVTLPVCALSAGLFKKSDDKNVTVTTGKTGQTLPSVTTAASETTTKRSDVYDPDSKTDVGTDYVTNLRTAVGYRSIAGLITDRTKVATSVRVANYNTLLSAFGKYSEEESGKIIASDSYDSEKHVIVRGNVISSDYLSGTEVITRYQKQYNDFDASYVTLSQKVTIGRKSVQPYMGYLLVASENGSVISLCDSFGNILAADMGGISPYYARDKKNRPVFTDGEKYFVFGDDGFEEIEKESVRVGLFYDFPASEYAPTGVEVGYDSETGEAGYYVSKTGALKLGGYYKAFNFSERLAVVMLPTENSVRVISTSGRIQFVPRGWYSWDTGVVGQGHSVGDLYTLPDTFGIESIGCDRYDHGWVRMRVVTKSHVVVGKVVSDTDTLVNKSGKKFDLPDGYTLEGYSDGVLLLSKKGKYGFYTIDGEWIAQPMFTYATPFIQGLAVVGLADGTVGMIDTDGNIVLPFVFTSLSQLSSGVIVGYCEGIGYETFYLTAAKK